MKTIKTLPGLILLMFIFYFLPLLCFKAGDIFFEDCGKFYNHKLAKFFFERASYPIFGKAYPYAHHQLSRTYFIEGDLELALIEANKELEVYPEHKATYYILGLTLGYMNREKKAIEAFSKYIEYNPKTWAARNDKAWLQFRIGDVEEAIITLKPVVEKQEYNVWVQNTYCALMINKKDYLQAEKFCNRAAKVADIMSEEAWGKAYPGNDPRIYGFGLRTTRKIIESNQLIIKNNLHKG